MPVTRRDGRLLWKFVTAVGHQWVALMSGGLLVVALGLYERFSGTQLPLGYYALAITVFFFIAMFGAWREENEKITPSQNRPRIHTVFDWRGCFGCYEPILLKNDSDVPAQNIRILDIVLDEQTAKFQPVSYIDGRGEVPVWPNIDGAATRDGHPDFAKFMLIAQLGNARAAGGGRDGMALTLKSGATLPFVITYSDLDGVPWKTQARVMLGGAWGSGRIVIETVGFE